MQEQKIRQPNRSKELWIGTQYVLTGIRDLLILPRQRFLQYHALFCNQARFFSGIQKLWLIRNKIVWKV